MGAWDLGPFDNDSAADWCGDLRDAPKSERESLVRRTLNDATDEPEYLDIDAGSEVVAAVAVVAAVQSKARRVPATYVPDFPVGADFLTLTSELVTLANKALDRVVAENSELRETHIDEDQLPAWMTTISVIRVELNGDS